MKSNLRIGIAGLGFGSGVHLPVFQAMANVKVQALLGRNSHKVESLAQRFGIPAACTSSEAFMDQPLDAVVISLPPASSGALAAAALDRNLAILSEKPIARDAAEACALAARSSGKITLVDFEFRELASFNALRDLVRDHRFGAVRGVDISWRASSYAQRNKLWSWKTDAVAGGGVLTLSGLHLFNLLEWIFGPIVVEGARLDNAATQAFAPRGARAAVDTADLKFRAAGGTAISAHLTNAAEDRPGHRWRLETDGGTITLDDGGIGSFGGFVLMHDDGRVCRELARDPDRDGDYRIGPVGALAERFIAAIRGNRQVAPSFDEGSRAQIILEDLHAIA